MSVSRDHLNQLVRQSQRPGAGVDAPQAQDGDARAQGVAAGAGNEPPLIDAQHEAVNVALLADPQPARGYVTVKNLHKGEDLASRFHRVMPNETQVREKLGDQLLELYDVNLSNPPASRIPQAALKQVHQRDFDAAASAYDALHDDLKGQQLKGTNVFQKLWIKIKGAMQSSPLALEATRHAGGDDDQPRVDFNLKLSDALVTVKLRGQQEGQEPSRENIPEHRPDDYKDEKSVSLKKWLYGIGIGAAAALAVGLGFAASVAALPVLAAVGLGVGAAALGLTALGLSAKAIWGKHPWWGGTVTGQLQREEREDAIKVGDDISAQVRETVMQDLRPRNVSGKFEARNIVEDSKSLQNFIRLARANNSVQLENAVRDALLKPGSSPLSQDTIDKANTKLAWYNKKRWGQGNEHAHAKKTVDLYAREITLGIMRGINEARVQTLLGELSDELTKPAYDVAAGLLVKDPAGGGVLKEFVDAVQFLEPRNGNQTDHPIAKTEDNIARLDRMLAGQVVGEQTGSLAAARALIGNSEAILGPENAQALSDVLQDLEDDLRKHIASQRDVQALIKGDGNVTLQRLSAKIAALLQNGADDAEGAAQALTELQGTVARLKARILDANDPNAGRLVESHAKALTELVGEVGKVADRAAKLVSAEVAANSAFGGDQFSLNTFEQQKKALADLKHELSVTQLDMNPSGLADDVLAAHQALTTRFNVMQKRCDALDNAKKRSDETAKVVADSLRAAVGGDLAAALSTDFARQIEDNYRDYTKDVNLWVGAGVIGLPYAIPRVADGSETSLSITSTKEWKRQVLAEFLGIRGREGALQPVLDRLVSTLGAAGADDGAVKALRKLGQPDSEQLITLLTELQEGLTQEGGPTSQTALDHLVLIRGTLENDEDALEVAYALHPDARAPLLKFQTLQQLTTQLREAQAESGANLHLALSDAPPGVPDEPPATVPGFLRELAAFCQRNSEIFPNGSAQTVLKRLADQLGEEGVALDRWIGQARNIESIDTADLGVALTLTKELSGEGQASQALKRLLQERDERRAQAGVMAQHIQPGAASSDNVALRDALVKAAGPKDPVQRQALAGIVKDLLAAYRAREENQSQGNLTERDIRQLADNLRQKIGFKGSTEELIARIKEQPEIQRLLRRFLEAQGELQMVAEAGGLPSTQHAFTQDNRVLGAKMIAEFAPTSAFTLGNLPDSPRQAVETRDRMAAKFRDKSEAQVRRALKGDSTVRFVDRFLLEQRVYGFLKQAAKSSKNDREYRIAMEGSGDQQEQVAGGLAFLRAQALAHVPDLRAYIEGGIRKRVDVIKRLIEDEKFVDSGQQGGYLGTELVRLLKQIEALNDIEEVLENPLEGERLAALGSMLFEADAAAKASEVQLRLSYIQGQHPETVKALKHFNIRNFKYATGWGNLFFRLFNRGEVNLRRVTSTADVKAMADEISKIAAYGQVSGSLQEQKARLDAQIAELEKQKDALVNGPEKVKAAFLLVMLEHLADKGSDEISQADYDAVVSKWSEMLGPEAANHQDFAVRLLKSTSIGLLQKDLGISEAALTQMANARAQVREQQEALEAQARVLKNAITQQAIQKAEAAEHALIEKSIELGLGEGDYLVLAHLVGKDRAAVLIGKWASALDHLESGRMADGWAQASDARIMMERLIEQKPGTDADRASMQRLIGRLETEVSEVMGQQYQPLDSFVDLQRPAALGQKLSGQLIDLYGKVKAAAENKNLAALEQLTPKLLDIEQALVEGLEGAKLEYANVGNRPFSLLALQRLGVECQSILGAAFNRLGMLPAEDGAPYADRAKYYLYHALGINQKINTAQGSWKQSQYQADGTSNYATTLKNCDIRYARVFKESPPQDFNADQLQTLRDQATGAANQAVVEEQYLDRDDMDPGLKDQLTSAIIEGSADQAPKMSVLQRIGGIFRLRKQ